MIVFHVLHGAAELYWYPGTSVISENRRFGCDAADTVAGIAKQIITRLMSIVKKGIFTCNGGVVFFPIILVASYVISLH
jgi:hypothetical protein